MDQVAVEALNNLYRMELSTLEAYRKAYEKLNPSPLAMEIYSIEEAHEDAINQLSEEITRCGGEPQPNELGWGVLSKLYIDVASLFREREMLAALVEREEKERDAYEHVIKATPLPEHAMRTVRYLLAQETQHLQMLQHVMRAA